MSEKFTFNFSHIRHVYMYTTVLLTVYSCLLCVYYLHCSFKTNAWKMHHYLQFLG